MNEHYVINLGRQLGSGGKEIGEKLAQEFGGGCFPQPLPFNSAYNGIMTHSIQRVEHVLEGFGGKDDQTNGIMYYLPIMEA